MSTPSSTTSRELAARLYERWISDRRKRPDIKVPASAEHLKAVGRENFLHQFAEPRKKHLKELAEVEKQLPMAEKAALLVMMELPPLEISTLLDRLHNQLSKDPKATYFSKTNMADNCGCGCGCGCAVLSTLPWDEQISMHRNLKPFSIDPFNEVGVSEGERDSLLARDFLRSFESLSETVSAINRKYING